MKIRLYITEFIIRLAQQLWLSISNVGFYQNVYSSYKGYGLRYIFTISFFATVIQAVFLLNDAIIFKDYFVYNKQSKGTEIIEYIINQLPELYYDGTSISASDTTPIYLKDKINRILAVLDPNNQLSYAEKEKIPIILTSNNVIIFFTEVRNTNRMQVSFPYHKILGTESLTLNTETIKNYFANIFLKAPRVLIYIITPLLILKSFIALLLNKVFVILLFYTLTNIFGPKMKLEQSIRLILFADGVPALLKPIVDVIPFDLDLIIPAIRLWTNLLLLLAVIKIRGTKFNVY